MILLTVVYGFRNHATYASEWERIRRLVSGDPVRVLAVSADDEVLRVNLIEEALRTAADPFELAGLVREIMDARPVSVGEWE